MTGGYENMEIGMFFHVFFHMFPQMFSIFLYIIWFFHVFPINPPLQVPAQDASAVADVRLPGDPGALVPGRRRKLGAERGQADADALGGADVMGP